jgi:ribosomal protein S27E
VEFDLDVDCPDCRYPIWVRRSELAAQVSVLCPCCRLLVRLVNPDGSAQTIDRQIEQLVDRKVRKIEKDLDRMLKGMFG